MTIAKICMKKIQVKTLPWQLVLPQAFVQLSTAKKGSNGLVAQLPNNNLFLYSLFLRQKRKIIC